MTVLAMPLSVDFGLLIGTGIIIFFDFDRGEFHLTARPDYSSRDMERILMRFEQIGLVPFDGGEVPEEVLEDGSIRIHMKQEVDAIWR